MNENDVSKKNKNEKFEGVAHINLHKLTSRLIITEI